MTKSVFKVSVFTPPTPFVIKNHLLYLKKLDGTLMKNLMIGKETVFLLNEECQSLADCSGTGRRWGWENDVVLSNLQCDVDVTL